MVADYSCLGSYNDYSKRFAFRFLIAVGHCLAFLRIAAAESPLIFPICEYPDLVFATAEVEDSQCLCVIDSGSTGNTFHTSLRAKLGASHGEAEMTTADGEHVQVESFPSASVTIGSLKLGKDALTSCLDLSPFREAEGRNITGLIGMPLFRACTLQMDFDNHRCTILHPPSAPRAHWGQPVPISVDENGLPTIPVRFSDKLSAPCIVDTGFTGALSLESRLYDELSKERLLEGIGDGTAALANGIRKSRKGKVKAIKLEDIEIIDVVALNGGAKSRIGLELLRRFLVTFDIPHQRLYLAKGFAFVKSSNEPVIGLGMLRKGNATVIAIVQPGSSAEGAGVLVGEELLMVGGEGVAGKPLAEIRWMFRNRADANGRVKLVVRRRDDERSVVVTIREPTYQKEQ